VEGKIHELIFLPSVIAPRRRSLLSNPIRSVPVKRRRPPLRVAHARCTELHCVLRETRMRDWAVYDQKGQKSVERARVVAAAGGRHTGAPLSSLPTFLLTTSPSPAPLTSVRWPDSNAQAAASGVP